MVAKYITWKKEYIYKMTYVLRPSTLQCKYGTIDFLQTTHTINVVYC